MSTRSKKAGCIVIIALHIIGVILLWLFFSGQFMNITLGWFSLIHDDNADWTPERIEDSLSVSIPQDAVNVSYDGEWGRLTVLNLSFQATAASMDAFTSHLCFGRLHPHYDPFNAINLFTPVDYEFAAYINMT